MGKKVINFRTIFEASLARTVEADADLRFVRLFYDKFKAADKSIGAAFVNTDMERLFEMVKNSLTEMTKFAKNFEADDYMCAMAINHGQGARKIRPELFDIWLDCLIEVVREQDPEASDDVVLAWRIMLAPGIAYMKYFNGE